MRILDPKLERIAVCAGTGPVGVRSVADQRLLAALPASTNLTAHYAVWSPDGRFLGVKRDYGTDGQRADWEIWDTTPTSTRRILLLRDVPFGAISFHPRRSWLLAGKRNGTVTLWDLKQGTELGQFSLNGHPTLLRFAPNGKRYAAVCQQGNKFICSVRGLTNGSPLSSHVFTHTIYDFAWEPGGHWLAVPELSGEVSAVDAQSGKARLLGRHKAQAVSAVFSPDGTYLFTGGWERELICWDAHARHRMFTVRLNSYHTQISADGRRCAVLTQSAVQLHTLERPALSREFAEELGGARNRAAFSSDGRWLAASGGKRLVVWDLNSDGPGALPGVARNTHLSFTQNGELFASRPGSNFRWRVTQGTNGMGPNLERIQLAKPAGFISLSVVSNGVITTSTNGSKLATFDRLPKDENSWTPTIAGLGGVSPDERWLGLYRSFSPDLYIHRLPGLECVTRLGNQGPISRFEFSPAGDELAVASRRGVEFWSTVTWQRIRQLTNYTGIIYSPDARTIWLTTDYRTAGLYDARTAELLLPLPPNVLPLAVSADGRHLAASVDQQRVQVWDLVAVRERLRELGLDWTNDTLR